MAMTNLPALPYGDGIRKAVSEVFGGYNHNLGAGNGTIWFEKNMTSDYYPVMGTRAPRYRAEIVSWPYGIYALEGLWIVNGTKLTHNGTEVCDVIAGRKQFAAMGKRLLIWPDKIVVNAETIDLNTSALYYRVAVALPSDLADGEYEYTLADEVGTLSTGIAYVGELARPTETDTHIEYEQIEI